MPTPPDAPPSPAPDQRFEPHATRELGAMFDHVSERYDLLNRLMTLGQDAVWRRAMWREVPDGARAVLDLCTGSGVSLGGLRRPGRLVLGVDISLGMLEVAAAREGHIGWAPRLACADAFALPLRDGAVDCVTVAFGLRNLRPRGHALAEIARVLCPGGTLVVLEATAPRLGPFAPAHAFYLRRVVPALGRISPDPSAYRYLAESILEFGAGAEFERDLAAAGFAPVRRSSFFAGATGLWSARRRVGESSQAVQGAPVGERARGEMPIRHAARDAEWRWWNAAQLVLAVLLVATLGYALTIVVNYKLTLPLEPWQRGALRLLLGAGIVFFALRSVALWLRLLGPSPRA